MKNGIKKFDEDDFHDFWNKRRTTLQVNNPDRFYNSLHEKIKELQTVDALDEYVYSLKTRKESTRRIIVAFYNYLNQRAGYNVVESSLFKERFYDYAFERQLEIAKFLHDPHTGLEIEEAFNISDRTRREDLKVLEEGIEVLGSTIQIQKVKKGNEYYYRSTMHPIFLPLNLTEVYALTTYLPNVLKGNYLNRTIILNIVNRIKAQLSNYAFEKLFPNERQEEYVNEYLADEMLAMQREGVVGYLMKSGQLCSFYYEGLKYCGRIRFDGVKYKIVLADGSDFIGDIEDVDFVIDSVKYK